MSGVTVSNIITGGGSSLIGGAEKPDIVPPNFITECFFLSHILISFIGKRLEQGYQRNYE